MLYRRLFFYGHLTKYTTNNIILLNYYVLEGEEVKTPKVFESEYRFCLILWENEPITCAKISDICKEKLGWARTTTYTVIKRLGDRGVLKKEGSTITSLVTKEEIQLAEMNELFEERFEGSLPAFIAAFAKKQKLSEKEYDELKKLLGE